MMNVVPGGINHKPYEFAGRCACGVQMRWTADGWTARPFPTTAVKVWECIGCLRVNRATLDMVTNETVTEQIDRADPPIPECVPEGVVTLTRAFGCSRRLDGATTASRVCGSTEFRLDHREPAPGTNGKATAWVFACQACGHLTGTTDQTTAPPAPVGTHGVQLALEPVALDWDGKFTPIDQLDARPAAAAMVGKLPPRVPPRTGPPVSRGYADDPVAAGMVLGTRDLGPDGRRFTLPAGVHVTAVPGMLVVLEGVPVSWDGLVAYLTAADGFDAIPYGRKLFLNVFEHRPKGRLYLWTDRDPGASGPAGGPAYGTRPPGWKPPRRLSPAEAAKFRASMGAAESDEPLILDGMIQDVKPIKGSPSELEFRPDPLTWPEAKALMADAAAIREQSDDPTDAYLASCIPAYAGGDLSIVRTPSNPDGLKWESAGDPAPRPEHMVIPPYPERRRTQTISVTGTFDPPAPGAKVKVLGYEFTGVEAQPVAPPEPLGADFIIVDDPRTPVSVSAGGECVAGCGGSFLVAHPPAGGTVVGVCSTCKTQHVLTLPPLTAAPWAGKPLKLDRVIIPPGASVKAPLPAVPGPGPIEWHCGADPDPAVIPAGLQPAAIDLDSFVIRGDVTAIPRIDPARFGLSPDLVGKPADPRPASVDIVPVEEPPPPLGFTDLGRYRDHRQTPEQHKAAVAAFNEVVASFPDAFHGPARVEESSPGEAAGEDDCQPFSVPRPDTDR